MKLLELPHTLAEKIERLLQPILLVDTVSGRPREGEPDVWRAVEQRLDQWQQDPESLADEGMAAPSRQVLALASTVAEVLSGSGIEPPDAVIPNGDAGVVFRWRAGKRAWSIELDSDGSLEAYLLHEGKLVWRHALHEAPRESP